MRTGKILAPKVKALYEAVEELIFENIDVKGIKVSDITNRAGIGKGTAYEYFENKEEIISSALLYHIDMICKTMLDKLGELKDLSEMMYYILCTIDGEIKKRDCFIQFVHLLSDNGAIGRVLQGKIKESGQAVCMPRDVLARMVQVGVENGEINAEIPLHYVGMTIASKVVTYIIYITDESKKKECSKEQMYRLICNSLKKELG